MRELDLDALLREKREEPTTVSISAVDSWLKRGVVFAGLFATLKWLFTKKMWLMFTSISSISIVTILAIVQLNSNSTFHSSNNVQSKTHPKNVEIKTPTFESSERKENPVIEKDFMKELYEMTFLTPNQLLTQDQDNSIEPVDYKLPIVVKDQESKDQFSRIDANGFVHFTLVKGSSCSIQNTIPTQDGGTLLDYSIKNGTLYLNSVDENNASELIITVVELEKIKLNGYCEMITNSTYESTDLELNLNGFSTLNIDLNVKDLEIEMNGETKGTLNLKGKNIDLNSNGFSDVEIEFDFEQSRIEVTGFSKIKFTGTSITTDMNISGESKISAEEFASQELFLKVSGFNNKMETTVSSKLDVEISGENTVVILGAPEILHQEVSEGSKLKLK
ncbi:MAG: hypothetical protein RI922_1978 [Bacteroidota bacterium]|jgi:hypothetical protein